MSKMRWINRRSRKKKIFCPNRWTTASINKLFIRVFVVFLSSFLFSVQKRHCCCRCCCLHSLCFVDQHHRLLRGRGSNHWYPLFSYVAITPYLTPLTNSSIFVCRLCCCYIYIRMVVCMFVWHTVCDIGIPTEKILLLRLPFWHVGCANTSATAEIVVSCLASLLSE